MITQKIGATHGFDANSVFHCTDVLDSVPKLTAIFKYIE
jgi:hypothetical protein